MNRPARCPHVSAIAILASALLVLPSCRIPPLQSPCPGPPLPDSFNGSTSEQNSAQLGWREFFADPLLTCLVDQALVGNQELRILAQEIRIANYEILARRGEYFPFVTLEAAAGLEKPSLFTPEGAVEDQLEVFPGKAFPDPLPDFLAGANVTWEVDIWRKLRNARDAATLRYLGTRDGRNFVVTRLVAEIAENYYELLALDNRLKTLDQTIAIQEESLKIAQAKKAAARETELAVKRFQAEVRKNQSEKLIIQQQIVVVENRINFLTGRYPQPVERASENYIDLELPSLCVGLPSQLLMNRNDIRQAERELMAAGLDVQVARARFFPSLDMSAGVGLRAFNLKYLFDTPDSLIYHAAGGLVAPLINRAAIKADYLSANAAQLQAVYNYQRVILNAYIEVTNYLAMAQNYGRSIEIKKQQLEALEDSVENAQLLFQNARAEYMDVLLAQRDLLDGRTVLIETKQGQLSAVVKTYQALGGGLYPGTEQDSNGIFSNFQPPERLPSPNPPATQKADTPAIKDPSSEPLPAPAVAPDPASPSPLDTDPTTDREDDEP